MSKSTKLALIMDEALANSSLKPLPATRLDTTFRQVAKGDIVLAEATKNPNAPIERVTKTATGLTQYEQITPITGEGILGFVDGDELVFIIENAKGTTRKPGHQLFNEMMGAVGGDVKKLHGAWSNVADTSSANKNLGRINTNVFEKGDSLNQAIWKTWTGRQATEHGFRRVRIEKFEFSEHTGDFTNLEVVFER